MITRLHSVMPERRPEPPPRAYIITHDNCYWAGLGNGHDGQGWTTERAEAMEILPFSKACVERRLAKASGVGRVGLELADVYVAGSGR